MPHFVFIEPETGWFEPVRSFTEEWLSASDTVINRSSGSTGMPKDIVASKQKMRVSAARTNTFFGNDRHTRMLLCLPAAYIAGRMMIVRALEAGATLLCTRPALDPLQRITADMPVQFAAMTPAQAGHILQNPKSMQVFRTIQTLILGGAPLSPALRAQLLEQSAPGQQIFETYGMTETLSHIALKNIGEEAFRVVSPQVSLRTDSRGCLSVSDPELLETELQTNDHAEIYPDGSFNWLGRMDFVINSGGIKIHPEQLEKQLAAHPQLRRLNYYIGKKPDERFGEVPVLYIESAPFAFHTGAMQELIARNSIPREIIFRPSFLYTESGKIKKRKLRTWLISTYVPGPAAGLLYRKGYGNVHRNAYSR